MRRAHAGGFGPAEVGRRIGCTAPAVRNAIRAFEEHNEAVRREIPTDRLLVFEVTQGWQPLCEFLNVPVPDEPFPHGNDRQSFAEMRRRRSSGDKE